MVRRRAQRQPVGISDCIGIAVNAAILNRGHWPPEAEVIFRIDATDKAVGLGRMRRGNQSRRFRQPLQLAILQTQT